MSDATAPTCWCGNTGLDDFSPEYLRCGRCQTLVSRTPAPPDVAEVGGDESGIYGRDYWFSHQESMTDHPNIVGRARADLPERCAHWLAAVLRYRRPPARTLELGAAHGGFVALLRWAGFDAVGLELSPSIVQFARETFGVPMLHGPVEQQPVEPGTLDLVSLMDVLEHLPDPEGTMRHCAKLLKPDGLLMAQTPQYPEGRSYEELSAAGDPFLNHLKPREHLYLFSRKATAELFARVGMPHVRFEPAIFAQYDQFLVASRDPLPEPRPAAPAAGPAPRDELTATPGARLVEALLTATEQRDYFHGECVARLRVIESLAAEVERLRTALAAAGSCPGAGSA
jgi:SAM-dependent methyltransferase